MRHAVVTQRAITLEFSLQGIPPERAPFPSQPPHPCNSLTATPAGDSLKATPAGESLTATPAGDSLKATPSLQLPHSHPIPATPSQPPHSCNSLTATPFLQLPHSHPCRGLPHSHPIPATPSQPHRIGRAPLCWRPRSVKPTPLPGSSAGTL
ncbi:MAG: hypothetical protein WDW38_007812 [Sanguina aurantia]